MSADNRLGPQAQLAAKSQTKFRKPLSVFTERAAAGELEFHESHWAALFSVGVLQGFKSNLKLGQLAATGDLQGSLDGSWQGVTDSNGAILGSLCSAQDADDMDSDIELLPLSTVTSQGSFATDDKWELRLRDFDAELAAFVTERSPEEAEKLAERCAQESYESVSLRAITTVYFGLDAALNERQLTSGDPAFVGQILAIYVWEVLSLWRTFHWHFYCGQLRYIRAEIEGYEEAAAERWAEPILWPEFRGHIYGLCLRRVQVEKECCEQMVDMLDDVLVPIDERQWAQSKRTQLAKKQEQDRRRCEEEARKVQAQIRQLLAAQQAEQRRMKKRAAKQTRAATRPKSSLGFGGGKKAVKEKAAKKKAPLDKLMAELTKFEQKLANMAEEEAEKEKATEAMRQARRTQARAMQEATAELEREQSRDAVIPLPELKQSLLRVADVPTFVRSCFLFDFFSGGC